MRKCYYKLKRYSKRYFGKKVNFALYKYSTENGMRADLHAWSSGSNKHYVCAVELHEIERYEYLIANDVLAVKEGLKNDKE